MHTYIYIHIYIYIHTYKQIIGEDEKQTADIKFFIMTIDVVYIKLRQFMTT